MLFWFVVFLLAALLVYNLWPQSKTVTKRNYINTNVIITGASSGIGKSLALEISKCQPAKLVITGRRADKLEETKTECLDAGAKQVEIVVGDVSVESNCKYEFFTIFYHFFVRDLIEQSIAFFKNTSIDHLVQKNWYTH